MDTKIKMNRARTIASVAGLGLSLMTLIWILIICYVAYLAAPSWVLFEYQNIRPLNTKVGEPLTFVSIRKVNFNLEFHFNEVLFCKGEDGEYKRILGGSPRINLQDKTVELAPGALPEAQGIGYATKGQFIETRPWTFAETIGGYIPKKAGICLMDSYVTAEYMGVTKGQHLSVEFEVTE